MNYFKESLLLPSETAMESDPWASADSQAIPGSCKGHYYLSPAKSTSRTILTIQLKRLSHVTALEAVPERYLIYSSNTA